ncbi:MAG TPA: hypothetical protein VHM19_11240 [Polyangiales bacterium]|jgi:hypothetical protein|nr:hypothetical protein [Polyangiales bacterium]
MMRRVLRALIALALLSCSTGCYQATFVAPKTAAGIEHDEWNDFFLFGLIGDPKYDTRQACSGAIAKVRTAGNVGTGLLSLFTIGIYTPRKVYVTCADAAATQQLARQTEGAVP